MWPLELGRRCTVIFFFVSSFSLDSSNTIACFTCAPGVSGTTTSDLSFFYFQYFD